MSMQRENSEKNRWEEINGYWYYFDNEGYMVSDWTRIGGMNYCFSETGELQLGWCYNDEEEKWHYFHEDGIAQKGWYQEANGSWYWFSPRGRWLPPAIKTWRENGIISLIMDSWPQTSM
uniref:hypothetical protein n=1 Tax=Clostridium sp. NkU-1 TaxID=1095009 RepID=UPI003260ADEB